MKKFIFLLLLILLAFPDGSLSVTPIADKPIVVIEGDVIMGNTLPRYGTICEDVGVQNNPYDGFETLYTLKKGAVVELREQSHGQDRSWVMIKVVEWIPLSAVCW